MKAIKDKHIKKEDFFKIIRLFEVSQSEIENDWKIYKDQRSFIRVKRRIKSEMQKSRCRSRI
jgi:hypothetical protein